jgi:glycosyltransferase involved in cell wall biosynthesis
LEIKAEAPKPEIQSPTRGNPSPYARFSDNAKTKMSQMTDEWLGASGWYIGNRNLLDFTKSELLVEIDRERRQGDGHYDNMHWYEALVEPMKNDNQTIGDFWRRYKGARPIPPRKAA